MKTKLGEREVAESIFELNQQPVGTAVWEAALERGMLERVPGYRVDECELAMVAIIEQPGAAVRLKQSARVVLETIARFTEPQRNRWRASYLRWPTLRRPRTPRAL